MEEELLAALLAQGPLEKVLGAGSYKDDKTLPVNNLSLAERRLLLSGAGVKIPLGFPDVQQQLIRYILEQEYRLRAGNTAAASRTHQQMRVYMGTHGVKFMNDEVEDTDMTTAAETAVATTDVTPPPFVKKGRKPAAVKKAAKAAAKEGTRKGAKAKANGAEKPAKKRARAKSDNSSRSQRITDPAATIIKLEKMAEEGTLPKQAMQFLQVLKENGRKLSLEALLKAAGKVIETKQGLDKVFTFYRKKLVEAGHISVTVATE